ncbi:unnamed protein product [Cylindrotheca closterium]|uniref:Uncharacterized protein n=1 Tax=Cylindrotheca closterium TaxID=2856 RepID=A0AAD2JPF0_9STRA|nr:unnamed protein product [Cylindrotheca closterium]
MDEKEEMPPKSNNDDEEEEIVEHVEFVYDSEDKEITEEIKRTMTKLIVRGPNVKTIKEGVFKECAKLKEIDFTEATALETIGYGAFFKCPSLLAFKCPSNVKTIGQRAFLFCENLKEIDFTEATALETIGGWAFRKCPSLLAFKCPSNVKTIGDYAFCECENLKEIDFTEAIALETIGEFAFYKCPSLLAFKCPSNVKTIGRQAFAYCSKLKEIDFTKATALETIAAYAFGSCPSLLAFKCPSNVKTIGQKAFAKCENLEEIDFTKATGLETIGDSAFYECPSLLAFKCPSNVKTIGQGVFEECAKLKEIDFTEATALETIAAYAFGSCPSLLAFKCPSNVKTIGQYAFRQCAKLKEIDFTEATALETIGERAFCECPFLLAFKCPSNVKTIGVQAFAYCDNLEEIDFTKATALETIGDSAFRKCPSLLAFKCPSNVKTIGVQAFAYCDNLKEIDFTEATALETIEDGAFYKCPSLLAFKCPSNAKTIGESAFFKCERLKEIDFTEATALKTIAAYAFKICPSLLAFKCPSNVKTIGKNAFEECTKLKEIDFTEATALETIGEQAFYVCPGLLAFKCPSNVKTIGEEAFAVCENLKEIDFTKATALESIGYRAFYNCSSLLAFKCPSNVKTIGDKAFQLGKSLKEVDFTEATALETIGESSFGSCRSLLAFKCPSNVKTIEKEAFDLCKSLKEIDFTKATALETIGEQAFCFCASLLAFKCPSNVKTIGKEAFRECAKLKEIDFIEATALETIGEGPFYKCTSLETVYFAPNVTVVPKNILEECPNLQFLKIPSGNPAIHIRLYISLNEDQKNILLILNDIVNVYACNPIKNSELLEKLGDEKSILHQVRAMYIGSIVDGTRRFLSIPERNGWLQFLANNMGDGTDDPDMSKLLDYLETVDIKRVRELAETKDQSDRAAKSVASKHIQKVFEKRLFFLGRYDIARGPPIHQSATCVVVKATDAKMREYFEKKYEPYEGREVGKKLFQEILGKMELIPHDKENIKGLFQRADVKKDEKISKEEFVDFCLAEIGGTVVLKFMRNKDQFRREVNCRINNKLDSKYVVGSIRSHDKESDANLVESLKDSILQEDGNGTSSFLKKEGAKAEDYCNVLVMPYGERNLDTIFRSERLDILTIQTLMKEIGKAVAHLHKQGLIHGDLKMLNVIRINGHMVLIDMDASAKIGEDFAGEKYSSGVIPPEMIYQLANYKEKEKYVSYFQDQNKEEQQKRAPKFTTRSPKIGYAVKSFLGHDETTTFEDPETGNTVPKTKRMVTSKGNLPMFEVVGADSSFDVWSFGVLLYTLCSKHTLFQVNTDDDIFDGNSMRELYHWGQDDLEVESILENSIQDDAAKNLLKKILKRHPKDRPSMNEILLDPFFSGKTTDDVKEVVKEEFGKMKSLVLENRQIMQHGFSKIHESLNRLKSYQETANALLKGIVQGKKAQPKFLVILPAAEQDNHQEKQFSRFLSTLSKIKNASSLTTKARLCFICPISLQPVVGTDGKAIGYDIKLAKDWIKKYGPAILIGLKIVQVGLAVGRGFGLPLPSLSGAEEGLLETSDLFAEIQGLLVDGMGGDAEEDGLADMMLEKFADRVDSAASAEGPVTMKKNHLASIQKSYDGIGLLIDDEEFKRCGLVQAVSSDGKEYEYVHPNVKPLFEKFGSKCLEMSMEERETENAMLAAEAREDGDKDTKKGSPKNGHGEMRKHETAVPVPVPVPVLVAPSDSIPQSELQGIPQGSINHVVHKGWLRIQSRWPPYLWKQRYVVVYNNCSITQYPNAGSTYLDAKWIDTNDGTMELRSGGKVVAKAKLSKRCTSSTIAEWCQGNNMILNSDEQSTPDLKNRKAAAASFRGDHTGNVIQSNNNSD